MSSVDTSTENLDISYSVRALYRIIGKIIGRQISDRVASDARLDDKAEKRKALAQEVIDSITAFRKELLQGRDFNKIEQIIADIFEKDEKIAIKQFAWILEAYLLLNQ